MTRHRLYPATSGPATVAVDGDNYTMGTEFYLSEPANAIAVFAWRPANAPATDCTVAIFRVTSSGTGVLVAQREAVVIPANYNGWYRVELLAPVALLASPERYVAAIFSTTDNFYAATPFYWTTGAGMAGIVNGILTAPSESGSLGGQSRFRSSALGYPADSFNSTNYWIDVEVETADPEEPEDPNTAPTANAGPDQAVETGTLVTLTGTGTDPDGTIIGYSWTQVGGAAVTLAGTGATRTFTPSTAGLRTFRLTVTDDDGATAQDTVVVTATAPVVVEPGEPGTDVAPEEFDIEFRAGFGKLLAAEGVGRWEPFTSSDVGIVDGDLPATPENAIALMSYSVSDDPVNSDSVLGLQVQTRAKGSDPRGTAKLTGKVYDQLHGLTNVVLPGGVYVVQCYRQSWLSIGQDENNRWREKSNFYVTVHRPSKYRV